jgi:hypothetical protein
VPIEGEQIECDGLVLHAERVARRRIGRVRIMAVAGDTTGDTTDDGSASGGRSAPDASLRGDRNEELST